MKWRRLFAAACAVLAAIAVLSAQDYAPPPVITPNADSLKEIAELSERLEAKLASLHRQGVNDAFRVDAEIYLKAAQWITRHNEFYDKGSVAWTLDALDRGILRASQLSRDEMPWLKATGHAVVRGYRSRVDGSVQPFAVTYPADFGKDTSRNWRVEVVLHGRDPSLNEIKFLHQHNGDKPAAKEQDFIQLDIFGRGNNAYRWAGETDVNEAIGAFLATERELGRSLQIDPQRFVLRGFSMGGAGTWHLGLHQPSRWAVIGPGAGFTTTRGYWKDLPDKLPPAVEACLHIYDAVDYADNAFDVPIVAYAGENDEQAQAAKTIAAKLKPLNIPMTLLLAPGLKHEFPAEWRKKAEEEYAKHLVQGRASYPPHVRFVTYSLKYPQCAWVNLLSLERHYQRAEVDAEYTENGYKVQTKNVRALHLEVPSGARKPMNLAIDGQALEARPYLAADSSLHFYLDKRDDKWSSVFPERLVTERYRHPQKMPNLQGPIDDAFTSSFLCVKGTGKPWNAAAQKFADEELKRFAAEWNKFFRGELPVKEDVNVTAEDIEANHLILFGDPGSNSLIAQTLDALPLVWDKETIKLGGHSVSAAAHVPALVYPSPLNLTKYVVLNSGHTFRTADFLGTNARLFPRLGDYALLKPMPSKDDPSATEVVTVGLFDDSWRVPRP
jgi:dienelactone hydrolase